MFFPLSSPASKNNKKQEASQTETKKGFNDNPPGILRWYKFTCENSPAQQRESYTQCMQDVGLVSVCENLTCMNNSCTLTTVITQKIELSEFIVQKLLLTIRYTVITIDKE